MASYLLALLDDLCALALIYFHAGSSIRPEFGENSGYLSNYITANKTQDKITKKKINPNKKSPISLIPLL